MVGRGCYVQRGSPPVAVSSKFLAMPGAGAYPVLWRAKTTAVDGYLPRSTRQDAETETLLLFRALSCACTIPQIFRQCPLCKAARAPKISTVRESRRLFCFIGDIHQGLDARPISRFTTRSAETLGRCYLTFSSTLLTSSEPPG